MDLQHLELDAQIFKAVNSENRLKTFYGLAQGRELSEILDDLDVTRSAVQYYIDDFKETDLIRSEGKTYTVTEKGEFFQAFIKKLDGYHRIQKLRELEETMGGSFDSDELQSVQDRIDEETEKVVDEISDIDSDPFQRPETGDKESE